MMIKEKLEDRFPDHDWSHCEENTPFNHSNGVYWIEATMWYDDLPQWTSAQIASFLSS
jgi:hypothetical protein